MRISPLSVVACLLATVAAQSGPTSNPPTILPGFSVTAGSSSTFTWVPTTSGTVTLTLRNGPASNLNRGTVLASGIANSGSYTFTVPSDTASGAYTIEISSDSDASDANYSDIITVQGSGSVGSASPSPSASMTTTSSSTSSTPSSTSSSTDSSTTTTTSSETSTTSHTSTSKSSSSSSTSTATKSASSASGTSAPTSSTSTPTGSSKGANAGIVLSVNNGLLALVLGVLIVV